jgi:putative ABC transport system permease protein
MLPERTMTIPLSYSLRNLWARRATSLATAAGIALTVFVLTGSQMLSTGMRGMLVRAGSDVRALVTQHEAYAESNSRIRQVTLTHAAAAPGVRRGADGEPLVTGEVLMPLLVSRLDDGKRVSAVQLRGVSGNVFAVRPEVRVVDGRPPHWGRDEAMIGTTLLDNYTGVELGGHLTLRKGRRIAIVGVFEAQGSAYESEIWTGLDVVRTAMGWEGFLSSVTAVLDTKGALDGFAAAFEADHSLGLTAVSERAYYEKISEGLARSVTTLGDLVTLIFGCGAMLGGVITMNEAIARRRREIGLLRALGFSAPEVMAAFLLEAAGLALLGALLGVCVASLLSLGSFSMTNFGSGNEIAFPFEPHPSILLRSLVLGTLVGVLGGFFPALKAARTNPLTAMRV